MCMHIHAHIYNMYVPADVYAQYRSGVRYKANMCVYLCKCINFVSS